jgi:hypothetical protein
VHNRIVAKGFWGRGWHAQAQLERVFGALWDALTCTPPERGKLEPGTCKERHQRDLRKDEFIHINCT